jgi:hypothetical protein
MIPKSADDTTKGKQWESGKGGEGIVENVWQDLQMRLVGMKEGSYPLHQIQFHSDRNSRRTYAFNTRPRQTQRMGQDVKRPGDVPYPCSMTLEGGDQLWRAADAQP